MRTAIARVVGQRCSGKANRKVRICIDNTGLNKACPKDSYPLPTIDQLIDATTGHLRFSFLNTLSGYHQIKMAKEDIPETAFITCLAVYAFKSIPFDLVDAEATY